MRKFIKRYLETLSENYKLEKDWHIDPAIDQKWYRWKDAVLFIDPFVGRNTLLVLLKAYGILDSRSRPIVNNKHFNCFRCETIKRTHSLNTHYYNGKVYFIKGEGILEIRRLIRTIRLNDGNI